MAKQPTKYRQNWKFVFTGTRALICLVLLGLLLGAYFLVPRWFPLGPDNTDAPIDDTGALVWHTVDVGQGDCTIVQFPDNKVLMVDAGKPAAYDAIDTYLQTWQITTIDWFVVTHPDDDHYGGATKLLANENLTFGVLYYSAAYEKDNATYNKIIQNERVNAKVPDDGEVITSVEYNYTITFVSPFKADTAKDSNDASLMMTIEYYNKIFVLTGDASSAMDDKFIAHAQEMGIFHDTADKQIILKVAHHGSSSGSSIKFLDFIFSSVPGNNYALISCNNKGNNYDHPHKQALERLQDYVPAENILVTQKVGDIVIQATAEMLIINDTEAPFNTVAYSTIFIALGVMIVVLCFCQFNTKSGRRK